MNLQKIISIVLGLVGLVSVGLLGMIISTGDEAIKNGESHAVVDGFMTIAYVTLGIILVAVVLFTIFKTLSNPTNLKRTLVSVGAFALFAVLSFVIANGVETPLKDGGVLSETGSQLVGASLYLFYFLGVIAVGSMLMSSVKKMIK